MQNYQNNYQDQQGNVIPGASVTVRQYPSNVLATIYSDNGITPLPNPMTTDSLGMFLFYAANGSYSVQCTKAGFATQTFTNIQLFDTANVTTLNTLNITSTTDSTSTSTGALTVAGGVGVAKNLYVGGAANVVSTTQSTTPSTGAVVTAGGVGIAKDIYCAGTYHGRLITSAGTIDNIPIGSVTPNTGAFTTVSATGAITPNQTAGIVGTTTNNNANAGSFGEFSTLTASGVSLSNGVAANITSVSLTAGDWDVSGIINFQPAGGATPSQLQASVNTVSASMAGDPDRGIFTLSFPANNGQTLNAPIQRISLSSTTTVYLVGYIAFTGGTATATGRIRARRVR